MDLLNTQLAKEFLVTLTVLYSVVINMTIFTDLLFWLSNHTFLETSLSNPNTTTIPVSLQKLYENYYLLTFNWIIFFFFLCLVHH